MANPFCHYPSNLHFGTMRFECIDDEPINGDEMLAGRCDHFAALARAASSPGKVCVGLMAMIAKAWKTSSSDAR